MARADYCGNGEPHTKAGTKIYIQDYNLGKEAIRTFGQSPPTVATEAIWGPDGAYCASQRRVGTDWPNSQVELQEWCTSRTNRDGYNAYGMSWQACQLNDPTVHGLDPAHTPYLTNKSKWEPPIAAPTTP